MINLLLDKFFAFFFNLKLRRSGVKKPKLGRVRGFIMLINRGTLLLGDGFRFNSGRRWNPIGGDTIFRIIVEPSGRLTIGRNVGISNSTIWCKSEISIGDNVLIGGGSRIWDTDFHSLDSKIRNTSDDNGISLGITIGSNVFIGAGSIILKGISIGDNSIIAAGSVVSRSIPANEVWGGSPMRKLSDAK